MFEKGTLYFEKCGKENTGETVKAAKRRAEELNIRNIVVGTTRGTTARARGLCAQLVSVFLGRCLGAYSVSLQYFPDYYECAHIIVIMN